MANKSANQRTKNAIRTIKRRMRINNKQMLKQNAGMATESHSNEPIVVGLVYANWCYF